MTFFFHPLPLFTKMYIKGECCYVHKLEKTCPISGGFFWMKKYRKLWFWNQMCVYFEFLTIKLMKKLMDQHWFTNFIYMQSNKISSFHTSYKFSDVFLQHICAFGRPKVSETSQPLHKRGKAHYVRLRKNHKIENLCFWRGNMLQRFGYFYRYQTILDFHFHL